jgi:mRNA interferase RelE/StbE
VSAEPWRLDYAPRARRDLRRLEHRERDRIRVALERLAVDDPRCDVRPLRGESPPRYRLRVGELRVIFRRDVETHTLHVLAVRHRGGAYS